MSDETIKTNAGDESLNFNTSKTEMHSNYQSVDKQTGINAEKGGFDITMGNYTQRDGVVISRTAYANKIRWMLVAVFCGGDKRTADYPR